MRRIAILCFSLFFLFFLNVSYSPTSTLIPFSCYDSDGDCDVERIKQKDNIYELVDLLFYPYGWLVVEGFKDSIPEENEIDLVSFNIFWFTDLGEGASNIYIEYWNGSQWLYCAGPFGERGELTHTSCNAFLTKNQIQNLKVRVRGEDIDGFPMAFIYIDRIFVSVNHSAPPRWRNLGTNTTNNFIYSDEGIELSVELFDDVGLRCAWLSTNETGEWKNYTDGTYNSPICFNGIANEWVRVNFSWHNSSVTGFVSWKIYFNDTTGKENSTIEQTFFIQHRIFPLSCYDSDGDCDVERIKQKDNIYELVDLLFYPYGWLVVENFLPTLPDKIIIRNVSVDVFWFTDLGEGASNIYIEYWNGSQWLYCAGPFGERGELTHTSCNAFLTKNQIQNLKVRVRGEDIDGFPMAFIYIDRIFVSVNYTIGSPYLEVSLRFPIPDKINNVAQNSTFLVNATVYCRDGDCGEVFGILLYNSTTEAPDTPVSTIYGEKPFFIQEENSSSFKSCLKNPLKKDDYCFLRWVVNASGDLNTYWKIAVLFNSTNPDVSQNITRSATIFITFCTIDFTLGWEVLDFGTVLPNTYANPAVGNSNNTYKIFLGQSSCNLNLYIRGQNLIGKNRGNLIRIENISVSNSTNKFSTSFRIKEENQLLFYNISSGEYYTYYWMDLPPIYADVYIGEIYVVGVKNEDEV